MSLPPNPWQPTHGAPRRRGASPFGWILGGCGCLALLVLIGIVIAAAIGVGSIGMIVSRVTDELEGSGALLPLLADPRGLPGAAAMMRA